MENVSYKELDGNPANTHQKKLAKEKSRKQKEKKVGAVYYTMKNDKVVMLTVKPTGVAQQYVGKMNAENKKALTAEIEKWKKQGVWVESYMVDQLTSDKGV